MPRSTRVRQLAVLAYGSPLAHPGDWFGKNMEKLLRCEIPWPVEYAGRAQQRRGGAPTLVLYKNGARVRGGLIVLPYVDTPGQLSEVRTQVSLRETGAPNSGAVRDNLEMFGFRVVYCDFQADGHSLATDALAKAAIDSVAKCFGKRRPFMSGLRYLRENIEWGVDTPLTKGYEQAILKQTSCRCLEEAECKLLAKAAQEGALSIGQETKKHEP